MAVDTLAVIGSGVLMMMFGGASIVGVVGAAICLPFGLGRWLNVSRRLKIDDPYPWANIPVSIFMGLGAGAVFASGLGIAATSSLLVSMAGWGVVSLLAYVAGRISPNFYKGL